MARSNTIFLNIPRVESTVAETYIRQRLSKTQALSLECCAEVILVADYLGDRKSISKLINTNILKHIKVGDMEKLIELSAIHPKLEQEIRTRVAETAIGPTEGWEDFYKHFHKLRPERLISFINNFGHGLPRFSLFWLKSHVKANELTGDQIEEMTNEIKFGFLTFKTIRSFTEQIEDQISSQVMGKIWFNLVRQRNEKERNQKEQKGVEAKRIKLN